MHHILAITLMKIIYIAHPQGKLYHTLTQAIRDLDKDLPMSMIIAGARQSIKELLDTPIEEIAKSLYHIETFIPEKQYIYSSDIREKYQTCYKQASAQYEAGEYRKLCLQITHKFYESYYKYYLPEETDRLLQTALREVSGQPWDLAASVLFEALETLMQNSGKTTPQDPILAA